MEIQEKNVHVICMEDREEIRRVFQRLLGNRFAELCLVDTCEALVDAFLGKKSATGSSFDLVFLDMEIYNEKLCGLRALAELKKIDPDVRAVLCSASYHDAMYNPGPYGFIASLEKPFFIEEFNKVIRIVLSQ